AETPKAWAKTALNTINGSITSAGFASGGIHQQLRGSIQIMDRFGEKLTLSEFPGQPLEGDGSSQFAGSLVGTYNGTFGQVRAYRYRRDSPFAPYNGDPANPNPYTAYDTQLLLEGGHTREVSKRLTVGARAYANIYSYYDDIQLLGGNPFHDDGRGD